MSEIRLNTKTSMVLKMSDYTYNLFSLFKLICSKSITLIGTKSLSKDALYYNVQDGYIVLLYKKYSYRTIVDVVRDTFKEVLGL